MWTKILKIVTVLPALFDAIMAIIGAFKKRSDPKLIPEKGAKELEELKKDKEALSAKEEAEWKIVKGE